MYLKIKVEYQCSPLWVSRNGNLYQSLEIDESPFSDSIKMRLKQWALEFEGTLDAEYPPDSGFSNIRDEKVFEEKGIDLWAEISEGYTDLFEDILYKSYSSGRILKTSEDYKS